MIEAAFEGEEKEKDARPTFGRARWRVRCAQRAPPLSPQTQTGGDKNLRFQPGVRLHLHTICTYCDSKYENKAEIRRERKIMDGIVGPAYRTSSGTPTHLLLFPPNFPLLLFRSHLSTHHVPTNKPWDEPPAWPPEDRKITSRSPMLGTILQ